MMGGIASTTFQYFGKLDRILDAAHDVLDCFGGRLSIFCGMSGFDIDVEVQHTTNRLISIASTTGS